jgi:hypothetical protein
MAHCHALRYIIQLTMCGWPRIRPSTPLSSLLSQRVLRHWSSSPLRLGMRRLLFTLASHLSLKRVPMLFAPRLER